MPARALTPANDNEAELAVLIDQFFRSHIVRSLADIYVDMLHRLPAGDQAARAEARLILLDAFVVALSGAPACPPPLHVRIIAQSADTPGWVGLRRLLVGGDPPLC